MDSKKKRKISLGLPVATDPATDEVTNESATSARKRREQQLSTPSSDNTDNSDVPTPQPGFSGQQERGGHKVSQLNSRKRRQEPPVTNNQTRDSPRPATDNSDVSVTDSDDSFSTCSSRSEDNFDTQPITDEFLEFLKDPNKHAEQKAKDTGTNKWLYKYGNFWYSPDKARHGGSKFKVYTDTRKRLKFKGSIDEHGELMSNKHESMEGSTIPKSQMKYL